MVTTESSRQIATLVTYPEPGQKHSPINALFGYTKSFLSNLPESDRRQHVVISNVKEAGPRCFDDNGIEVNECWQKGRFAQWQQIIRAVRQYPNLKVIHLQHEFNLFGGLLTIPMIPILLAWFRWIMRKKIVVTLHEVVSPKMVNRQFLESNYLHAPPSVVRRTFGWYYRLMGKIAHGFIVHDAYFQRILREDYGIRKPVMVIPIGVDDVSVSLSKPEARTKLKMRPDIRTLLFFGAVARYKGLDLLMDAMVMLDPQKYQLLIAGGASARVETNPEYRAWMDAFKTRCASMSNVRLCGAVPDADIPVYFKASDLLILPYQIPRSMSFGMSIAAAYGLPFIASDAFREKIPDMFIFEQTPTHLAEKIQWFFDGHQQVMDNYLAAFRNERLWSKCASATAQFYGAIMSG